VRVWASDSEEEFYVEGRIWCPQRDSNPFLPQERADRDDIDGQSPGGYDSVTLRERQTLKPDQTVADNVTYPADSWILTNLDVFGTFHYCFGAEGK
jgi:hypothetical protein